MIKKLLFAGLLFVALVGLPITIYLFQNKQDTRSHASSSTTLSLIPEPGTSSAIQKQIGDAVPLDLIINPGNNQVGALQVQISYDPTKLEADATKPFTLTKNITYIRTPFIRDGTVSFAVSVGTNIFNTITSVTNMGTFNFKAIGKTTSGPAVVSFTNETHVVSIGSTEQPGEDVLSGTNSAQITIVEAPTAPVPSVTPTYTPTPTPTNTPTPTPTPVVINEPSVTIAPGPKTQLSLTVFLHSIGNSGDNVNPTAFSLSNKDPKHQPRDFVISLYNADTAQLVATQTGSLDFSKTSGNYFATVPITAALSEGDYIIKLKTTNFLQRRIPGFFHLSLGTHLTLPEITLVAGDSNGDNLLNILDYNMLTDCYSDFMLQPIACDDTKKGQTDLNDDGNVDLVDVNLFLREMQFKSGN